MISISPSLLSANFLALGDEIRALEQAGADRLHLDVMDGHFVPNLTFGPPVIAAIKRIATIPLDVHLMIQAPERSLKTYIDAGADIITIHQESSIHLERTIAFIKENRVLAAVALNPSTHESSLDYVLDELDGILVMSVNPGFSGQRFLPSALKKIGSLRARLDASKNPRCFIAVDGGIDESTAPQVIHAGADCLVSGSFIFAQKNYGAAIKKLKGN